MTVTPRRAVRHRLPGRDRALLLAGGIAVGLMVACWVLAQPILVIAVVSCGTVGLVQHRGRLSEAWMRLMLRPTVLRLRSNPLRDWRDVLALVPAGLRNQVVAIPNGYGDPIVASPSHLRVHWSVPDAAEASTYLDPALLAVRFTAMYADFVVEHALSVPGGRVLVELVPDVRIPRGRLKIQAVSLTRADSGGEASPRAG